MSTSLTSDLFRRGKSSNATELADDLRKAVEAGQLSAGEQLPTIRQISEETGLAYNAVNRAFSVLQAEGLLISRKRAGTFVAKKTNEASSKRPTIRIFALVGPELNTGFYPLLQKGFDQASDDRGYQIITSNTGNDVRVQASTILQLMDKSVAGVALVPTTRGPSPAHHIRQLQQRGIPVVMLHRSVEDVRAPLIAIPAEQVGELAARQILGHGHTRIAYCDSHRGGVSMGYEGGLRRTMKEAGIELLDRHIFHGDLIHFNSDSYAEYEVSFEKWFKQHLTDPDRPTVLFTSFEPIGEIAYLVALRLGLRVPQDLSIVTAGGQDRCGPIVRRLACVTINEQQAGQHTADLLDRMHRGLTPLDSQESLMIEIDFDPAESLASVT